MAMNANRGPQSHPQVYELTGEQSALISGGMIDLHQDGPHPGEQPPGRLVSVIGYRTFADVGL
jgi:hypothetical protein